MENIEFRETVENLDCSSNYSYLLNFWHVTKINKELEYIKRNGIHPSLVATENNGINDMTVTEGNPIPTYFYTSFRIFIKALFFGAEAFKTRDIEEWKVTYGSDKSHLDNLNYLIYKFNEDTINSNGIIRLAPRRYNLKNVDSFFVKLVDRDSLHAKDLLNRLDEMQQKAQTEVDDAVLVELNEITVKLAKKLEVSQPVAPKKAVKKETSLWTELERIRPEARPLFQSTPALSELLPVYNQLKDSIQMFNHRTRFSYLLNYAKSGSSNAVINNIQDNEVNYNGFMQLTNNMAA